MTYKTQSTKPELLKQFADHLMTVFTVGLVCLWLFTTRVEISVDIQRKPWWHYLILSVFVCLLWFFWARKKIKKKILRLSLPIFLIGFVWILYWISGLVFPKEFFLFVTSILFAWSIMLIIALLLSVTSWNKLSRVITKGAIWENNSYWPIPMIGFFGIFQGWKELWDIGMRDWWMDPLLYLAFLVFIIVMITHALTYRFEKIN